jgi:hypothetical protein
MTHLDPFNQASVRATIDRNPDEIIDPWYRIHENEPRSLNEMFPGGPCLNTLVSIARRHDRDEYACAELKQGLLLRFVVAHTWTDSGYTIISEHDNVWSLYRKMVEDAQEWARIVTETT